MPHPQRTGYTVIALGTVATLGLWSGAKGIILPHFLGDLSLAPAVGSAIFTATSVGSFIGSSSFAGLSGRFGLRRVSTAGALLLLAVTAAILLVQQPLLLYVAFALFGLGENMLELTASLPISLLYKEGQGGIMNLLHGFFGLGALAGSLAGAAIMGQGTTWRIPMMGVAFLLVAWAIAFRQPQPIALPRRSEGPEEGADSGALLRDPLVWAATLALTASVAVETGTGIWLPTYLQQGKGLSEAGSAFGATLFFFGFTATRLSGPLLNRLGAVRSVILTALLGGSGLAGLLFLPEEWFWLSAVAGSGIAITFATCLTLVTLRYPARSNAVFGLMYACANVAGILTGPALGLAVQQAGVDAAMRLLLLFYGAVILLIGYYGWAVSRNPKGEKSPAA